MIITISDLPQLLHDKTKVGWVLEVNPPVSGGGSIEFVAAVTERSPSIPGEEMLQKAHACGSPAGQRTAELLLA
jgi:hypothetical protein